MVLKKISPIIICVCMAFAVCVSAVSSADGINAEQALESVSNVISVERYLIALYESVHNTELTDEADINEVMAWAEANGIVESVADGEQNISEIPLTQETALMMLSRSYTELAEITDMITEVSHTANNRQPQPGMPEQPKEYIPDMGNAENMQQPTAPDNGGFLGGSRRPQMPKTEIPDDIRNVHQAIAEMSEIAEKEEMYTADLAAQPMDNTVPDVKNGQAPQDNGAFADGRPASDTQFNRNRPQRENMQMPSGNNLNQNNSQSNTGTRGKTKQDGSLPFGEESANNRRNTLSPENTQTEQAEGSDGQNNISNLLEEAEGELQMTDASQEQVSDVSLKEHLKEYHTTYIGLLILAAAFVFVKLFRRRPY